MIIYRGSNPGGHGQFVSRGRGRQQSYGKIVQDIFMTIGMAIIKDTEAGVVTTTQNMAIAGV